MVDAKDEQDRQGSKREGPVRPLVAFYRFFISVKFILHFAGFSSMTLHWLALSFYVCILTLPTGGDDFVIEFLS